MEKREKIIVIASIIAAAYGALDFLVLSKKSSFSTAQKNNSAIITAAKTKLSSQAVDGEVQNLITRINSPWPKGIFFNRPHDSIIADGDNTAEKEAIIGQFNPALFEYSGFLQMAGEKIAIINGTDYKINDKITGFTLTQISPDKIQVSLQGEAFDVDIKPEDEAGTITQEKDTSEVNINQD